MKQKETELISQYVPDDEIDLFELFASLAKQWRWLLGVTLSGLLMTVVVALSIPKQYEVTAEVVLPNPSDAMLISDRGYSKQTTTGLFLQYYQQLTSAVNFNEYLQQGDWLVKIYAEKVNSENRNALKEGLRKGLEIEVTVPKKIKGEPLLPPQSVALTMFAEDERLAVDFMNGYVDFTGSALLLSIERDGYQLKALEEVKVGKGIQSIQADAQRKLRSRVVMLNEALALANKIGIKKPNAMKEKLSANAQGVVVNAVGAGAGAGAGLFLKGSEYLSGELDNIKNRKLEDTHIPALFPLFKRLDDLAAISFDFVGAKPYKVNKHAQVDGQAEKPKRSLIVAVGGVLSLFVGIFVALIVGAVKRRRALA